MNITLRYAIFRHKNKFLGRFIEALTVVIAIIACAIMISSRNIDTLIASIWVLCSCFMLFWCFNNAEKMRRTMSD